MQAIDRLLERIPLNMLVFAAILLGLAPFTPMPHLVEKVGMLMDGTLSRPIDIFDLLMHATPALVLVLKLARRGKARPAPTSADNEK